MFDFGFLPGPAGQEAQCIAMAAGTIHLLQNEKLGLCLYSEEEALDEERLKPEDGEAFDIGVSLTPERADITKAARLLKRIAKAWLWNRMDDLQGCIRACKLSGEVNACG